MTNSRSRKHKEESAHEAGDPHPRKRADDDNDSEHAILEPDSLLFAQICADDDQHENSGEGQECIGGAHQNRIGPAAKVAR